MYIITSNAHMACTNKIKFEYSMTFPLMISSQLEKIDKNEIKRDREKTLAYS